MGYVVLLGEDVLEPGASAFAQVRLERPTFALPGDRFIVRQYSPMTTIGGGEIVDAQPGRHRRSDVTIPEALRTFQTASLDERVATLVERAGTRAIDTAELVEPSGRHRRRRSRRRWRGWPERGRARRAGRAPRGRVARRLRRRGRCGRGSRGALPCLRPLAKGIAREEL